MGIRLFSNPFKSSHTTKLTAELQRTQDALLAHQHQNAILADELVWLFPLLLSLSYFMTLLFS